MKKHKIIFMGTPKIARIALDSLTKKYEIILVVTQADKNKDRKGNYIFSEVKQYCIDHNISYLQPEKVKEIKTEIEQLKPDLIVTCAFGQFVSESILNIPKYKSVNLHASLLPKLRGGAPMQWAIINGYKETGLTLMYMDKLMDHGNIIKQIQIEINPLIITYSELYQLMEEAIIKMINEHFDILFNEKVESITQNENEVTFGYNILKKDRYINWNCNGNEIIYLINGLADTPLALAEINNIELKIKQAEFKEIEVNNSISNGTIIACDKELLIKVNNGIISVLKLQAPNKKMLDVKQFLNGNNIFKQFDKFNNK